MRKKKEQHNFRIKECFKLNQYFKIISQRGVKNV